MHAQFHASSFSAVLDSNLVRGHLNNIANQYEWLVSEVTRLSSRHHKGEKPVRPYEGGAGTDASLSDVKVDLDVAWEKSSRRSDLVMPRGTNSDVGGPTKRLPGFMRKIVSLESRIRAEMEDEPQAVFSPQEALARITTPESDHLHPRISQMSIEGREKAMRHSSKGSRQSSSSAEGGPAVVHQGSFPMSTLASVDSSSFSIATLEQIKLEEEAEKEYEQPKNVSTPPLVEERDMCANLSTSSQKRLTWAQADENNVPNERTPMHDMGDVLDESSDHESSSSEHRGSGYASQSSRKISLDFPLELDSQPCIQMASTEGRLIMDANSVNSQYTGSVGREFRVAPVWRSRQQSAADGIQSDDIISAARSTSHDAAIFRSTVAPSRRKPYIQRQDSYDSKWLFHASCPIHPISLRNIGWLGISLTLLSYDIVVIPLGVFNLDDEPLIITMRWITAIFWTLDIMMSFVLGFHDKGRVVMELKAIVRRYIRTWFPMDMTLVTIDWLFIATRLMANNKNLNSYAAFRVLRIVRITRLARVMKAKRQFWIFANDIVHSEYVHVLIEIKKLILSLTILSHLVACIWYEIGKDGWVLEEDLSKVGSYSLSLHWALTQFSPGSISLQPTTLVERIFSIFLLLFGLVVFSSIISSMTRAVLQLSRLNEDQERKIYTLRRYLKERKVSRDLSARINRYVHHLVDAENKDRLQEQNVELVLVLSSQLRDELHYEVYRSDLYCHPLMTFITKTYEMTMIRICNQALTHKHMAFNDWVFFTGEDATAMYIVINGVLTYTMLCISEVSETIRKKQNIGDDERFGNPRYICEAPLWTMWSHRGDLHCASECEVLSISGALFGEIMCKNPRAAESGQQVAHRFVQFLNLAASEEDDNFSDLTGMPDDEWEDLIGVNTSSVVPTASILPFGSAVWLQGVQRILSRSKATCF